MSGLKIASSSSPLTLLTEIEQKNNGDGVLFIGKVSNSNNPISGDYVAYLDEIGLWTPDQLWIDLSDGKIAIDNDTYQATNWPVDNFNISYLQANMPVTVVSRLS
jgi:hypothetical protein